MLVTAIKGVGLKIEHPTGVIQNLTMADLQRLRGKAVREVAESNRRLREMEEILASVAQAKVGL